MAAKYIRVAVLDKYREQLQDLIEYYDDVSKRFRLSGDDDIASNFEIMKSCYEYAAWLLKDAVEAKK